VKANAPAGAPVGEIVVKAGGGFGVGAGVGVGVGAGVGVGVGPGVAAEPEPQPPMPALMAIKAISPTKAPPHFFRLLLSFSNIAILAAKITSLHN
jgi:hypothetical protein